MQMDLLSKGRFVFRDITNRLNVRQITPCNEVENKKEETSRKREYRAWKKAEANNPYHGTLNHLFIQFLF